MSQEYYGNNGEYFPINTTWNRFLDRMTLCLWDKMGIPRPLSKEDALLIARIMNNYITLQKITAQEDFNENSVWSMYGLKQDGPEALKIAKKIAEFFERCNGLMTEEEKAMSKMICNVCGNEMQYEDCGNWYCLFCGNRRYEA